MGNPREFARESFRESYRNTSHNINRNVTTFVVLILSGNMFGLSLVSHSGLGRFVTSLIHLYFR